jgi:tetraacyldisaccharide 4'-kinase
MDKIPAALAPLVYIPGLVFEAMVRVRNRLYATSLLPQHRLPAPVISIGNMTMGGTGKTPLVIYLARMLVNLGITPAILTRGYGRQAPHASHILPPGKPVPNPAETLGDEPALIRRHVPEAWMGVSKNRLIAGREIAQQVKRPVFILDDGYQHRRLYRDWDIVIVDRCRPLIADRMVPRGTLREPISELRRCHWVVINGPCDQADSDSVAAEIHDLHKNAHIVLCSQSISGLIPFSSWRSGLTKDEKTAKPKSAFLAAAVGNPGRFHRDVLQMGIEVWGSRFFPDHYWPKTKDWQACVEAARFASADAIVITEKDAIKISQPPDYLLQVAVQSTMVFNAGALELSVKNLLEARA